MRGSHFALASTLPAALFGMLVACGSFSSDAQPASADGGTEAGVSSEAAAVDAPLEGGEGDAGAVACATRADAPLMCADFDELPTPHVYSEGIASSVQQLANRVVIAPGKSAPNAMWSDARSGNVQQLTVIGTTTTTRVHVALDVFVESYDAGAVDGAFVRVGVSPDQCYVDIRLLTGSVLLQTHCVYTDDAADFYRFQEILSNGILTSEWVHLELDVDYASAKATATIDGSVRPSLGLNPSAKQGGTPYVDVGVGLAKVRVGFDNVLAVASQ